jgi:hypothetical protein
VASDPVAASSRSPVLRPLRTASSAPGARSSVAASASRSSTNGRRAASAAGNIAARLSRERLSGAASVLSDGSSRSAAPGRASTVPIRRWNGFVAAALSSIVSFRRLPLASMPIPSSRTALPSAVRVSASKVLRNSGTPSQAA